MSGDRPSGWHKPRSAADLQAEIAQVEQHLAELRRELDNLQAGPRLEAIAQVRNIMRAHGLSIEEVTKRRRRTKAEMEAARR